MAGRAELTGEISDAGFVDAGKDGKNQSAGASRKSRLFGMGRRQDMVASLSDADAPIGATGSPAQRDRLIPSHQSGDEALSPAPKIYTVREPWGIRYVVVSDDEEQRQPEGGSNDSSERGAPAAAQRVSASLYGAYTAAQGLYERQALEEEAAKPAPGGDGEDEPPGGKDRTLEAGDPDSPINRAKGFLSETFLEQGITPDSITCTILNHQASYTAYTSLRAKVAFEHAESPNETLVDAVESVFADSFQKIQAYENSHPAESDTARGLLAALLPKYEEAVYETDDSLSERDVRIRAASLMGVHMDEMRAKPKIVYTQDELQPEREEKVEAQGETLAEVKQRLSDLVLATKPDSPKLAYLQKYAEYMMRSRVGRLAFLTGRIQNEVRAQREFEDAFKAEVMFERTRRSEFNEDHIQTFYEQGIYALYKDAIREPEDATLSTREKIRREASLDATAAVFIYDDLKELMSEERPVVPRDPDENPYVQAQEKLVGEFLGADWHEKPLLAEVLKLQLRMSQTEVPGMKAIIAQEQGQRTRAQSRGPIENTLNQSYKLQEQFIADNGHKWIVQRRMHPYDFYAALWAGEEVYQAYVDAAMKETPPDRSMSSMAQIRIDAATHFKWDVTPLILTQNILRVRGHLWNAFRYPRY